MASDSAVARYVAEFVGAFMLVFSVGCNLLSGGGDAWAVTSIACTLMVGIYAFADVSGGHLNPAVSWALVFAGKFEVVEAAIYSVAQILGGIAAGFAYSSMFGNVVPLAPKGWWQAGLAELFYTFMLTFVVLNVAASKDAGKKNNQFYGLAIGFVVVAGGYGAGAISGGCFNPAVAFGLDISSLLKGKTSWYCFMYLAFEIVGAGLAAAFFRVCRPEDYDDSQTETPALAKYVSEFLGTYMLVLTVGLNVLGKSPAGAWSIASSLMCMIFALGSVSGAHFNPAVTTAAVLRGAIGGADAAAYVGCQLLGGIAAGFTYTAMYSGTTFALGPQPNHTSANAWIGEAVFTFLLAYVVLKVATIEGKELSQFFGLAIGSCITVGGLAIGKVSGGSLNPAVSAGITFSHLLSGGSCFAQFGAYILCELLGGVVAAGLFFVTNPSAKGVQGREAPLLERW